MHQYEFSSWAIKTQEAAKKIYSINKMLIISSLVILVLSILAMSNLEIKNPAKEDFEAKIFNDAEGNFLRYRIHYPDDVDGNSKYPLILFFHGSGERGENNTKQLLFGVHNILDFSKEINEPTIIIAPKLPLNQQWVDMPWDNDFHIMPKKLKASQYGRFMEKWIA